jgi:hypothetical protein
VLRDGSAATLLRAVWRLGVLGSRRRWFWRLVAQALRRGGGLGSLSKAVTFAILGEHLIRYTREEVLPRLDRVLGAEPAEAAQRAPELTPPPPGGWALPAAPPAPAATAGS